MFFHLNFHCVICGDVSHGDILGEEARVQLPEARNVPDQYWECLRILSCQWKNTKVLDRPETRNVPDHY